MRHREGRDKETASRGETKRAERGDQPEGWQPDRRTEARVNIMEKYSLALEDIVG